MPNKKSALEKIFGTLKKAVAGDETPKNSKKKSVKKTPAKKAVKKSTPKKAVKKTTKKPAKKATPKKPAKKTPRKTTKKESTITKILKGTKTPIEKEPKQTTTKKPVKTPLTKYIPKKKLESLAIKDPREQDWVPERSKIRAAIQNGLPESYLSVRRMLYIGAAHGYTIAHIHEKPVELYAVEKSREMMQYFLPLAEDLPTVLPIYADAANPDSYAHLIPQQVDLIFQDIAQRDQVGIFLSNCSRFLSPAGVGMLCLKAKNVNSTAEPQAIFADARQKLEREGATIVQEINLEPYHKHHRVFVVHLNPYHDW